MVLIHPIFIYTILRITNCKFLFKKIDDCFVLLNLFPYICILLSSYGVKCPFNTLIYREWSFVSTLKIILSKRYNHKQ